MKNRATVLPHPGIMCAWTVPAQGVELFKQLPLVVHEDVVQGLGVDEPRPYQRPGLLFRGQVGAVRDVQTGQQLGLPFEVVVWVDPEQTQNQSQAK